MRAYLDACVVMSVFVDEPTSPIVRSYVSALDLPLHLSALAAGEYASALSRLVRTQKMVAAAARQRLELFDEWRLADCTPIAPDQDDCKRVEAIVRRFELKLLVPDAMHAVLCERHGLTLVTLDKRLAEAATRLDVTVVVPA